MVAIAILALLFGISYTVPCLDMPSVAGHRVMSSSWKGGTVIGSIIELTRVEAIRHLPIDPDEKGFGGPAHRSPVTAAELVARRTVVHGGWLGSPRAHLRKAALQQNLDLMASFCADAGVTLYPHGKTTMSPQILAEQLERGAGGVTVATAQQARVFRRFGVSDVLIANQVTDPGGIAWLGRELAEHPEASIACYVDSVSGVRLLTEQLAHDGFTGRLAVLVELGHENGRTGARTQDEAVRVAEAVGRSSCLSLIGVAGYEGTLTAPTAELTLGAVRVFCDRLGELAGALSAKGCFAAVPVVTAGGSAYFDIVVSALAGDSSWRVVLRSGCYATHDHGLYRSISAFERAGSVPGLLPALEVWAPVLSRPERGTAVVGAGRRDLSFDAGLPVPLRGRTVAGEPVDLGNAFVRQLFDQHAIVTVPEASNLVPGDEVGLGISHPCTTFDKWRWIPILDEEETIVDVVRTYF